jgi:hypothetical protein
MHAKTTIAIVEVLFIKQNLRYGIPNYVKMYSIAL